MASPYSEAPDPSPDEPEEGAQPGEKVMGFLDHLEELRWTLVKCAIVLVVFVALSAFFLRELQGFLEWPWRQALAGYPDLALALRTDTPMQVYGIMFQICTVPAFIASVPLMLLFLGQFASPALTAQEKRVIFPSLIAAFGLFLLGAVFAFRLLTTAGITMAIEANKYMGYAMIWTVESYYTLVIWLLIGMGAVFEFPLVVLALTYLRIVELDTFRRSRRLIVVLCLVAGAVVTPTVDPLSMFLVAVPMYGLFELSLIVSAVLLKRRARREAEEERLAG